MFPEGDGTWILESQLNWFRLIPQQDFICPLLDLTPIPEESRHLGL
jgi:hypothetical protein